MIKVVVVSSLVLDGRQLSNPIYKNLWRVFVISTPHNWSSPYLLIGFEKMNPTIMEKINKEKINLKVLPITFLPLPKRVRDKNKSGRRRRNSADLKSSQRRRRSQLTWWSSNHAENKGRRSQRRQLLRRRLMICDRSANEKRFFEIVAREREVRISLAFSSSLSTSLLLLCCSFSVVGFPLSRKNLEEKLKRNGYENPFSLVKLCTGFESILSRSQN